MTDKKAYAANVVSAKLYGLVGSPTELVLGNALFAVFADFYEHWWCRVFSATELAALPGNQTMNGGCVIGIVPQFPIPNVGRVDFGLFAPHMNLSVPLVVIECDGHEFHERTPEQASKDRKRDRALAALDTPLLRPDVFKGSNTTIGAMVLRFTGADILRDSNGAALEIADVYDRQLNRAIEVWFNEAQRRHEANPEQGFYVPFMWPPMRRDRKGAR